MSINAIVSEGCSIEIEKADSPAEFEIIVGIATISGPGGQATIIDVSDLQSTAKEKRPGLTDFGAVTLEGSFIPNDPSQIRLFTAYKTHPSPTLNFRIRYSDSPESTFTFTAFVLGFSTSLGVDQKVSLTVNLETSGDVVLT